MPSTLYNRNTVIVQKILTFAQRQQAIQALLEYAVEEYATDAGNLTLENLTVATDYQLARRAGTTLFESAQWVNDLPDEWRWLAEWWHCDPITAEPIDKPDLEGYDDSYDNDPIADPFYRNTFHGDDE